MSESIDDLWPHSPPHWLFEPGIYMVTAGTCHKAPLLHAPDRLELMQNLLFGITRESVWSLQAWAILRNHYHFVATSPIRPEGAKTLSRLLGKLHMLSAKELNRQDNTPGRKVWFQFWESHVTFQSSHLARLRYVHENPVHHDLTPRAVDYRWCSAAWFEKRAPAPFVRSVNSFKTDKLRVQDDF